MTRETLVPSIPDVRDDNVGDVLRAIKNVLQVREGHLGDPLDQNVTLRDLTDLKVVASGGSTPLTNGTLVPVINPTTVGGYDPTTDLTSPPAPTGLTASATFTNVYLAWTGAPYRNHAYTEIWRATSDNLGSAVLVGRSNTNLYADAASEGQTYYYWIRFVSVANVIGAYNATAGTPATTATNPATLLTLLTGQIRESQLYSSLSTRINLIDAADTVVGSVNNRIAVVQAQVNDLLNTPNYNNATAYQAGTVVTYNGGLYEALQATTGNLPTNTTYWKKIGDYSSLGDAVAAHTTQISSLNSGLGQEITDRTVLATQLRGGYTGTDVTQLSAGLLYSERQARASADSSLATQISTLSSTVSTNNTTLNAAISSEATTRASSDSALGTRIDTLTSTVNSNNTTVTASIASEASTRASADTALSNQISSVSARLNSGGDVYSSIVTAQNTASAKSASFVQSNTPIATKVGDLWIDTGNGNILKQWNGSAWVTADDQRIGATASSVTTLTSRMNNVTGYASGVTMEQQFYTTASQIVGLQGQYTVKIDINGYVSGFGLAAYANNSTPSSSFIVRADSFSIASPSGLGVAPATPFIVRTTGTTINGQYVPPGVYISDVFIQNGTISDAKISNITADKITTGTLNAAMSVNTGVIYGGVNTNGYAIGTPYFGTGFLLGNYAGNYQFFVGSPDQNVSWNGSSLSVKGVVYATAGSIGSNIIDSNGIRSSNYVYASNGWALNNSGNVELNTGTFRGQINVKSSTSGERMEITNSVIKIFDASGVIRVKLGDLNA